MGSTQPRQLILVRAEQPVTQAPVGQGPTPDPASSVASELLDVRDDLEFLDMLLEQMSGVPKAGMAANLRMVAAALDDARTSYLLLTGDRAGADELGDDVLMISEAAGRVQVAAEEGTRLGAGWGTFLDNAIDEVDDALDVLSGSSVDVRSDD